MRIIAKELTRAKLKEIAASKFGNLIKAVVDVERKLIAIDAELHSDLEALLLEDGSEQRHLWGINLYPELQGDEFIEFDSMINVRPSQNNKSRDVENKQMRQQIIAIVTKRVIQ